MAIIHEFTKLKNERDKFKNRMTKVIENLESPVFISIIDDQYVYKNKNAHKILEYIKNKNPVNDQQNE